MKSEFTIVLHDVLRMSMPIFRQSVGNSDIRLRYYLENDDQCLICSTLLIRSTIHKLSRNQMKKFTTSFNLLTPFLLLEKVQMRNCRYWVTGIYVFIHVYFDSVCSSLPSCLIHFSSCVCFMRKIRRLIIQSALIIAKTKCSGFFDLLVHNNRTLRNVPCNFFHPSKRVSNRVSIASETLSMNCVRTHLK